MISIAKIIGIDIVNGFDKIKATVMGRSDHRRAIKTTLPGIDSKPIKKGQRAIFATTQNMQEPVCLGVINNANQAGEGETFVYSVDSEGDVQSRIKLLSDGDVIINDGTDYAVKFSEIKAGFDELKDKVNSLINKYNIHKHAVSGAATLVPDTLEDTTTASVDDAKVESVKLP